MAQVKSQAKAEKPAPAKKVRVANGWLSVCSGCEISLLDMDEALLGVLEKVEFVHSPVLMDIKYNEIPDDIDVCILTGCIRNKENMELAKEYRKKSKLVVALGACACFGGVPGLGNLVTNQEIYDTVYFQTPSTINGTNIVPDPDVLTLTDRVYALPEVVKVDYALPGCPTPSNVIVAALTALLEGKEPQLPTLTVCDDCPRKRTEGFTIPRVKRWAYNHDMDPEKCILEQGYLCMGSVTRTGCDATCPSGGVPCRGCWGPSPNIEDAGAKMMSNLGSLTDVDGGMSPGELVEALADPVSLLYRYNLALAPINKTIRGDGK